MATGFILKNIGPVRYATPSSYNVFTVPAGHKYLLKSLLLVLGSGVRSATPYAATASFQISDAAGANFRAVTPDMASTTANVRFLNLAQVNDNNNPTSTGETIVESSLLHNIVLEAGQILRVVADMAGLGLNPGFIDVTLTVADYTI